MVLDVTVVAILKILILEGERLALATMQQLPMTPTAPCPKEALETQAGDLEQDSIHPSQLTLQYSVMYNKIMETVLTS